MGRRVFECAPEIDGCGVLWTPTTDRRPVQQNTSPWLLCPDCERTE